MLLTVESIEVSNFLGHREESVTLPSGGGGVVLLWGPSGAGKSSLLEAVPFSLYGYRATRAITLSELKNESWPDDPLRVRCTFDLGGHQKVQVYRGVDEKGRGEAWIVDQDGVMIEGDKHVSARVSELTGGMDAATFFATYFSQQGELDALVAMTGGDLRKFIQRMMGVMSLDKATRRASQAASHAQGQVDALTRDLPQESEQQLGGALAEAKQRHADLSARAHQAAAEAQAIETVVANLKSTVDAEREQASLHAKLTPLEVTLRDTRIPAAQDALRRAVEDREAAEQAHGRVEKSKGVAERLSALRDEQQRLAGAESALGAIDRLKQEAAGAHRALEQARSTLQRAAKPQPPADDPDDLTGRRSTLLEQYKALNARRTEEQENLRKITEEGVCFTCRRPIDQAHDHATGALTATISRLQEQIYQVKAHGVQVKTRLERAVAARDAYQRAVRDHERAEHAAEQAQRHADDADRKLHAARAAADQGDPGRLAQVRRELAELSEQAAALQADQRLAAGLEKARQDEAAAAERLEREREQLADTTSKLEQINATLDPGGHRSRVQELDRLQSERSRLQGETQRLRADAAIAQRDAQDAEAAISRLQHTKQARSEAERELTRLSKLNDLFRGFRLDLINEIRPALQERATQILSDLTQGQMPALIISPDYELSVRAGGRERPLRMCSGGERARAAFALRLALSQLVSQRTDTPVGFLVFDEIFGSQDEDHRRAIQDSLGQLRNVLPQTFLISHEESLRDSPNIDTIISVPDSGSVHRIEVVTR